MNYYVLLIPVFIVAVLLDAAFALGLYVVWLHGIPLYRADRAQAAKEE